jgi:enoyl-CoA hydratase
MSARLNLIVGHLVNSRQPLRAASVNPTAGAEGPSKGFQYVRIETKGRVGIVQIYRPKALNALNPALVGEVVRAISDFDNNSEIGCVILTGTGRAFAAGADILEMKDKDFFSMSSKDIIKEWEKISGCRIPVIAAVNGIAFGGGCEIAMMCDIIFASETAKFGQPEINIGTIPGAGGTQRLPRFIGKSKAMEMCLSGNPITAQEALAAGLVSAVLPADKLMPHALEVATKIANQSRPILILCKEAVNTAYETTLTQGMRSERRLFHSTFALKDQKEGMAAFASKRPPKFSHQ